MVKNKGILKRGVEAAKPFLLSMHKSRSYINYVQNIFIHVRHGYLYVHVLWGLKLPNPNHFLSSVHKSHQVCIEMLLII